MKKLNFSHKNKNHYYYNFLCNCGQTVVKRSDNKTEYCNKSGCHKSEKIMHGGCGTRLYRIWESMRSRCLFKSKLNKTYKDRGISICSEWNVFDSFKEWAMSNGYKEDLTIDRIDIDGNYSPINCEWITQSENTRRQWRDGHGKPTKKVFINNREFESIAKASAWIKNKTKCKSSLKSISISIGRRIIDKNLKPYKNYIIKGVSQ